MFWAVRGGVIMKQTLPESTQCVDPDGLRVSSLRNVKGEILIVGHGNSKGPLLDIGFANGNLDRESFSADEIAEMLVEQDLSCDHKRITVLIMQGGLSLSRAEASRRIVELTRRIRTVKGDTKELEELQVELSSVAMRQRDPDVFENNNDIGARNAPFVAMLANALASRGFLDISVSGFRGEVLPHLDRIRNNPGPYNGLRVYVTSGMLAKGVCKKKSTNQARRTCEDELLAPCDECLLSSMAGASFSKRLKHCRRKLLRSASSTERKSAQVCGAEAQDVTEELIFTVKSDEVKNEYD
jgi:hypothetical protein